MRGRGSARERAKKKRIETSEPANECSLVSLIKFSAENNLLICQTACQSARAHAATEFPTITTVAADYDYHLEGGDDS